jgi:hypothetical protein
MQVVIQKRGAARRRSHPIARPDTAEVASGDAVPCPNPASRAPGWPLGGQATQLAVGRPLLELPRRVALSHDRHLVI